MSAKSLTQSMSLLHTWGGLVFGWLLFVVLLSGSIAVYDDELTLWLTPEVPATARVDRGTALDTGAAYLRARHHDARLWRITLPSRRDPTIKAAWRSGKGPNGEQKLEPRSGAPILRQTEGGDFYLKLHEGLHIDRADNRIGLYIVGLTGIAMLVASISGVIVHKRIFKDLFLFRPAASRQRSWLDLHNVLGVLPLPFHVMMAYTGLLLLYWMFLPAGVQTLYGGREPPFRREAITLQYQQLSGAPPGPPQPTLPLTGFLQAAEQRVGSGHVAYLWVRDHDRANATVEAYRERTDRVSQQVPQIAFEGATGRVLRVVERRSPAAETQAFVAALHWLEWGGAAVRLVYFLAGLAGAGAVACGLLVFTTKRRRRPEGGAPWMRLVEMINVAAVAGCCVASVSYLWAERMIPVDAVGRAQVSVAVFFWAWLACLLHAGLRGGRRAAWMEQLGLTGALCLGAPLLGGHVLTHVAAGDGVRIGVDAGLAILGSVFLALVVRLARTSRDSRHQRLDVGAA